MDTDNKKTVEQPEKKPVKAKTKAPEPVKPRESVYTAKELAAAHKEFNTSYEIVAVALKLAKKDTATVTEARTIIERFKNKEVK